MGQGLMFAVEVCCQVRRGRFEVVMIWLLTNLQWILVLFVTFKLIVVLTRDQGGQKF